MNETRERTLIVKLTPLEHMTIKIAAAKSDLSISDYVRKAINEQLIKEEK